MISGVLGCLLAKVHHEVVLDLLKHVLIIVNSMLLGRERLKLLLLLTSLAALFVFLALSGCGRHTSDHWLFSCASYRL